MNANNLKIVIQVVEINSNGMCKILSLQDIDKLYEAKNIVKTVNLHDKLVALLKEAQEFYTWNSELGKKIEEALKVLGE
jgi:hypothetical protein